MTLICLQVLLIVKLMDQAVGDILDHRLLLGPGHQLNNVLSGAMLILCACSGAGWPTRSAGSCMEDISASIMTSNQELSPSEEHDSAPYPLVQIHRIQRHCQTTRPGPGMDPTTWGLPLQCEYLKW